MDFEQVKVIWDSQNEAPLYAVDQTSMHGIIRRRQQAEHRRTAWRYGREIAINALVGSVMAVLAAALAFADSDWLQSLSWINVPVKGWHIGAMFVGAVIWFFCAGYMWTARRWQMRREERFDRSLQGDLKRALDHIAFQIRIARSIVWWGLVPSWIAAVLWVVVLFHLKGAPAWAYGLLAGAMAVAVVFALACQRQAIRRRYQPRRRELEALLSKLNNPQ